MTIEAKIAALIAQAQTLRNVGDSEELPAIVEEINRLRDLQCRGLDDTEPDKPRRGRPPKAKQ